MPFDVVVKVVIEVLKTIFNGWQQPSRRFDSSYSSLRPI